MKDENSSEDKSKFNMAFAYLERINKILNVCSLASFKRDFCSWGHGLFTLSRELNYLFSKGELIKDKEFQRKIYPLTTEFEMKMSYSPETGKFMLPKSIEFKNYEQLWYLLNEYEMFLRGAMNRRDMLSVSQEDLRKAITNM